jgi:hypothetical protein
MEPHPIASISRPVTTAKNIGFDELNFTPNLPVEKYP